MTRRMKAGLQAGAALAMAMALAPAAGLAKEAAQPAMVPTYSFSGAYLAGRAAEFDNDLESAVTYYERALAFDAGNSALQQSLLLALLSQGRLEEALPYAEQLQSEPSVERFARLALAVDDFAEENYAAAEERLELTAESDLDRLIAGIMTAWAKVGQNDHDAALAYLDDLSGPDWYALFKDYQRALILAHGDSHDEAAAAFEAVFSELSLQAPAPDTFGRMAEAYVTFLSERGETDKALEVLETTENAGGGIATIDVLRRRIEEGAALQPLVATPADGASEILLNVATELATSGGDPFVRLYLHYALGLRADSDAALVQLARVAERQQEAERAIAFYERIDPASPWARFAEFQIGLNLADLDRHEEAIEHLEAILEEDPRDMRAYLALGGVYSVQKDYRSMADLYDRAVEQIEEPQRQHWNIFYQRGIAYERLKEWPKAEPNFKTALELFPDHPQVLNYLGYSWIDMDMNLEEGMELIRRAVEQRPSDGFIVDSLGWAYYKLGDFEEAVTHLERAVSLRPEDPILNDHLGDAYWRVGRRLEARFQWYHARDLEPEPELLAEIQRKLEEGLPPVEEGQRVADAAGTVRNVVVDSAAPEDADETENAEETEAEPLLYTVRPGQTLWSIAVEELGDGTRYHDILELNPALRGDPGRIRAGQELRLPPDER